MEIALIITLIYCIIMVYLIINGKIASFKLRCGLFLGSVFITFVMGQYWFAFFIWLFNAALLLYSNSLQILERKALVYFGYSGYSKPYLSEPEVNLKLLDCIVC